MSLNRKLTDVAKSAMESGVEVGATVVGEVILDGLIGSILPGIPSAILSYKQKRLERNLILFVKNISSRLDEIQTAWEAKSKDKKELIKEKFSSVVCDYVLEEKEEMKIPYMSKGFVSLIIGEYSDESIVIEFYDILERLRITELQVFVDYHNNYQSIQYGVNSEYVNGRHIGFDEFTYIRNKLINLGLLKREGQYTVDNFVRDLERSVRSGVTTGSHRGREKDIVTDLGKEFIKFFIDFIKEK